MVHEATTHLIQLLNKIPRGKAPSIIDEFLHRAYLTGHKEGYIEGEAQGKRFRNYTGRPKKVKTDG